MESVNEEKNGGVVKKIGVNEKNYSYRLEKHIETAQINERISEQVDLTPSKFQMFPFNTSFQKLSFTEVVSKSVGSYIHHRKLDQGKKKEKQPKQK